MYVSGDKFQWGGLSRAVLFKNPALIAKAEAFSSFSVTLHRTIKSGYAETYYGHFGITFCCFVRTASILRESSGQYATHSRIMNSLDVTFTVGLKSLTLRFPLLKTTHRSISHLSLRRTTVHYIDLQLQIKLQLSCLAITHPDTLQLTPCLTFCVMHDTWTDDSTSPPWEKHPPEEALEVSCQSLPQISLPSAFGQSSYRSLSQKLRKASALQRFSNVLLHLVKDTNIFI